MIITAQKTLVQKPQFLNRHFNLFLNVDIPCQFLTKKHIPIYPILTTTSLNTNPGCSLIKKHANFSQKNTPQFNHHLIIANPVSLKNCSLFSTESEIRPRQSVRRNDERGLECETNTMLDKISRYAIPLSQPRTMPLSFQVYSRGNPLDYAAWVEATGDSSWSYEKSIKWFKKTENYRGKFDDFCKFLMFLKISSSICV